MEKASAQKDELLLSAPAPRPESAPGPKLSAAGGVRLHGAAAARAAVTERARLVRAVQRTYGNVYARRMIQEAGHSDAAKPRPGPGDAERSAQGIQRSSLGVSSPTEPAELEAEATARAVMGMREPSRAPEALARRASPGGLHAGLARAPRIQRMADVSSRRVAPGVAAEIQGSMSGGAPLSPSVRAFMEPRFGADFGRVRVHTGERAARLNTRVAARAFTVGNHIFFGRDRFQPDTAEGRELLAHELTHTIQQGAAVQRSAAPTVHHHAPLQVQRLGISDVLDYFAEKAYNIPGYRMLTILLGVNPINMSRVERSAANVLRAVIEFIPGGKLITDALDKYGVFERAGNWVSAQIDKLGLTWSIFRDAIDRFLDSLGWRDVFRLGSVWERAKRIFTDPIDHILEFLAGLASGILDLIKDAILRPLAELAKARTSAWDLLCAVLGKNPITGDPVPQTAENLIGGFMKLIHKEEVWANIQAANAVPRAWAWFKGALRGLVDFVLEIPGLFIDAVRSLELLDIVVLPRAFVKVGRVFLNFLGRFGTWAGGKVLDLLQIIFEALAPGAIPYIRRTAAAFRTILQDPVGFIRNLVRAGIQGFSQFRERFLTHLRESLIGWLTGTLTGASIYIPQGFAPREILKFALSVLGVTWENVRQKLVRAVGEPGVRALEKGFDLVVTLVKEGPVAAWEKIVESIGNLRDLVLEQVMKFVQQRIVQVAIRQLLTSLNPAGAFIQAILAIYNTIMFFVERLRQIIQVARSFLDSIAAIASGVIAAAANRVETTMAGLLTLVISFLARLAGLGNVSDAVIGIINRIREPIDRALDRVVEWIQERAKNLLSRALGGRPNAPAAERLRLAVSEGKQAVERYAGQRVGAALLRPLLGVIRAKHRLTELDVVARGSIWVVRGVINPVFEDGTSVLVIPEGDASEWPTGSRQDPIPIKWFKPRDGFYPTIRVRGGAHRTPRQGILLPAVKRTLARKLTVSDANFMAVGNVTKRKPRGSESVKDQVRDHLNNLMDLGSHHEDYIVFSGSSRYAVDHIRDLTWDGDDDEQNLWPLAYAKNEAINASHNQQVRVRERDGSIRTNAAKEFPDRWFVIFKIATTAPGGSGDHGTTQKHPMNSGEGDHPKRYRP